VSSPVDWGLAERVAVRASGREPFAESYLGASLHTDFAELTEEAEHLVEAATGLRSAAGPARARVTDREGWIRANINSFQRLLRPLTDKIGEHMPAGPAASITSRVAGAEVGLLLGWMSTRFLGQYDMLVVEPDDATADDQDLVYYVGPNVIALEKKFAFPPREFRLWLALHEVTHRMQFTGVPWLREHYLGLVRQTFDTVDPDPKRILDALARVIDDLRSGRKPLEEGGVVTLFASPEQRAVLDQIGGLMSLLEGHGDVTMDRAGADRIPSAPRFSRVLRERRANAKPLARAVQRLIGLEAKLNQYAHGEEFIASVERAAGEGSVDHVWGSPDRLPTLEEIRDPDAWLDRVGLTRSA
jgi:coenzyme F420 biosynthesis associated uncharacterized protein